MKFINANTIPSGFVIESDVCIIGAGAAGIAIACAFDHSAINITLIEAGNLKYDPKIQEQNDFENIGHPLNVNQPVHLRMFGGSTNSWNGRCIALDEIDFKRRDWLPDSDWPLSPSTLSDYYLRASKWLGIPKLERWHKDYWMNNQVFNALASTELTIGAYLWSDRLRLGEYYRKQLHQSSNIMTYLNANVTELIADSGNGKIESIAISGFQGNTFTANARFYILASGGLENVRLLLISSKNHNVGIGNEFDNVGRYYINHPRTDGVGRLYLNKKHRLYTQFVRHFTESYRPGIGRDNYQLFLNPSENFQQTNELLNMASFLYAVFEPRLADPYLLLKSKIMNESIAKLSPPLDMASIKLLFSHVPILSVAALYRMCGEPFMIDHLAVVDQVEQVPTRESRITLCDIRDRFGKNRLQLNWKITQKSTDTLRCFHQFLSQHFSKLGIGRFQSQLIDDNIYVPNYTDASHPTGGTRMSNSPKTGVVDSNCRVFGFDNLYIAGSSVFPTGGHANPTLTIIALALRLTDHIKLEILYHGKSN